MSYEIFAGFLVFALLIMGFHKHHTKESADSLETQFKSGAGVTWNIDAVKAYFKCKKP
jgi:hypothetical protein